MRIIVPVKQVPETRQVRMDETTGTVIRDGVESIVNPLDLYAIEAALLLAGKYGAETVAISMGPPAAATALREAMAMGISRAILVSDRRFAGSDTWATACVLGRAIEKTGDYDLIICGERATDGDTGQVGPGIAAYLGLPVVSYVNKIGNIECGRISVSRMVEGGVEEVEMLLPGLLTVVKEVSCPRLPTLDGKRRARRAEIPVWDLETLQIEPSNVGLKGSPTKVCSIFKPKVTRECEKLQAQDEERISRAVDRTLEYIERKLGWSIGGSQK